MIAFEVTIVILAVIGLFVLWTIKDRVDMIWAFVQSLHSIVCDLRNQRRR